MTDYTYVGAELELFAGARRWKEYLATTIDGYILGDVLEVGAGIGETTRAFCRRSEISWTCLEPDAELAHQMRASFQASPLPLEPLVRTQQVKDLDSGLAFDTVLYVDVLEHIADDRGELATVSTHLRNGGHLIVIGPAHQWLFSEFDVALGHHRRYSLLSLSAVVPSNLTPRMLRYLDSLGVGLSAANRFFLRSGSPSRWQIGFWDRFGVPLSRRLDPLLDWRIGKSVVGVWQKA